MIRRRTQVPIGISNCICPGCGLKFPIPRPKSRRREVGHVKTIWCPICGKKQGMLEIRDDFYQCDALGNSLLDEPDDVLDSKNKEYTQNKERRGSSWMER